MASLRLLRFSINLPLARVTFSSDLTRRYQELRQARARLVEVHKKMLQVMDEMEAMRRQEVPKSGKNVS